MARRGPGQPTKRSPEREQAILNSLRVGNTRRASARAAEVSEDTLANWMKADSVFFGAVEKAESDAEQRFLGNVAKAAQSGNWQAAAWWLERRKHEDYSRRDKVDMTVDYTREAQRIAAEFGLDAAEVMAEAERVLAEHR